MQRNETLAREQPQTGQGGANDDRPLAEEELDDLVFLPLYLSDVPLPLVDNENGNGETGLDQCPIQRGGRAKRPNHRATKAKWCGASASHTNMGACVGGAAKLSLDGDDNG